MDIANSQRLASDLNSDVIFPFTSNGRAPEISPNDRQILRELAARVAELAGRPCEKEKAELWRAHNQLEPTRPVIFCDPEIGWQEIILTADLHCQDPYLQQIEWQLRREIFWASQMNDDRVTNAYLPLPLIHAETDWGVHEVRHGGENGGSYIWEAPIKTPADIIKLHTPHIRIDFAASHERIALLNDLFGDLLPVREKNSWWWTLGLSDLLARFRGLEQMMFDMIDAPDLLHAMMAHLSNGTLHMLDELERFGLLSTNHEGDYVGSGGFGWTDELPQADFTGQARTRDMWGFCESQETVSISPKMFAEFILPYQIPILNRFGLTCYGCCEPVDKRWRYIQQIPNLRRVSVSPWADRVKMAGYLEDRYVYSLKPNPSDFAAAQFDEQAVRMNLRQDLEAMRGCRVEIILKDVTTIRNEPQRLIRWVQIVREEIENF